MASSYSDIKSDVEFRLGNRSNLAAYIPRWINDAYMELLHSPRFSFYELDAVNTSLATTATVKDVDISGVMDLWFILSVRDDTNERNLKKGDWKRFEDASRTSGQPIWYDRYAYTLIFDPVPDGAYDLQIRYRKRVSELDTGSSLAIPREYDEILVGMIVRNAWNALQQYDKAAREYNRTEALIARMFAADEMEDMDAEGFAMQVGMEEF